MKDLNLELKTEIAMEEAATFSDRDDSEIKSEDDYYDRLFEEVEAKRDYYHLANGQFDLAF